MLSKPHALCAPHRETNGTLASWLVSFGSGRIALLLAMDLLVQNERMKAVQGVMVKEGRGLPMLLAPDL